MADRHLAGLDGLRAIAVGLVILCHAALSSGFPSFPGSAELSRQAARGVEIFFVLSGFLITWLLLQEERATGAISLRGFYFRRAFRILPAAVFYLAVLCALAAPGWIPLRWEEVVASLLFFRAWVEGSLATGHFWTLGIEEQFYLVWPFFLTLWPYSRSRVWLIAAAVLLAPVWNQLNIMMFGATGINHGRTDLRYGSLMMGCLLAHLRFDPRTRAWLQREALLRPAAVIAAALLFALSGTELARPVPSALRIFLPTAGFAGIALVINALVESRGGWIDRWMNAPFMTWTGRLSYSLYLWQQLFCRYEDTAAVPWIRAFPWNVAATFAAAWVSYAWVEQPMLRLRERLARRPDPRPAPLREPGRVPVASGERR
jgi:peptidoglycan/LPS O-acetylase OafA/YrhL